MPTTHAAPSVRGGALLAGLLLVLGGCAKQATREAAPAGESGTQTVQLDLTEFAFRPKVVEARAGQPLVLELHNEGFTQHTFTLLDRELDVVLDPGESRTVTIRPPEEQEQEEGEEGQAELQFRCRFHAASGMRGKIGYR